MEQSQEQGAKMIEQPKTTHEVTLTMELHDANGRVTSTYGVRFPVGTTLSQIERSVLCAFVSGPGNAAMQFPDTPQYEHARARKGQQ